VQLVELQEAWMTLQQLGVALFAVSYDDVNSLVSFAEKHGITYPLLSDTDSVTIRSLGLFNEHLEQQQAAYGVPVRAEQYGVPYPGTFVLDERGFIRDKHFEQSYRVRPTRSIILEWAGGSAVASKAAAVETQKAVGLSTWTDTLTYRPYQQLRLHAQLTLPTSVHVYAPPVPQGYQALSLELEPFDGLNVGEPSLPAGRSFRIAGLDEDFMVYDGMVDAILPFVLSRNLGTTNVAFRVRYQACSEIECSPPASISQEIVLQGLDLIRSS
jgi:peroxiredoxin